jgi:hypothetical protein
MYQRSLQDEQTSRVLDYSILGGAPFIEHLNGLLSGRTYEAIGSTLWRSAVSGHLVLRGFSLVTFLTLAWGIVGLFFAGGFVAVYASTERATVAGFVANSARSFGSLFRIGLIGVVLTMILFAVVDSWITYGWIYRVTMDYSSSLTERGDVGRVVVGMVCSSLREGAYGVGIADECGPCDLGRHTILRMLLAHHAGRRAAARVCQPRCDDGGGSVSGKRTRFNGLDDRRCLYCSASVSLHALGIDCVIICIRG